jgi:hypothetical protein
MQPVQELHFLIPEHTFNIKMLKYVLTLRAFLTFETYMTILLLW